MPITGATVGPLSPSGPPQSLDLSCVCVRAPLQAQTACPVGTYQPARGQVSCLNAPVGYYVSDIGAAVATPCPAGQVQPQTGKVCVVYPSVIVCLRVLLTLFCSAGSTCCACTNCERHRVVTFFVCDCVCVTVCA